MASELDFVEYVHSQAGFGPRLTHKKMFGEFALYLDGKVVAFVCDNQLYVKPTAAGEAVLGRPAAHSPFPGAKPYLRIDDELDQRELLQRVLRETADALPAPKPKPDPKPKRAGPAAKKARRAPAR